MICSFDGCERKLRTVVTREIGWCREHDPDRTHDIYCSEDGCDKRLRSGPAIEAGYCNKHGQKEVCQLDDCEAQLRRDNNTGFCKNHHGKSSIGIRRDGTVLTRSICSHTHCNDLLGYNNKSGYCKEHQMSQHRYLNDENFQARRRRSNQDSKARYPEKRRQEAQKRRALKQNAFIEDVDLDVVWKRDNGICCICNNPADPKDWWLEHIIPLSRGGLHCYENVGVSHEKCNESKLNKTMEEYRLWLLLQ